MNPVSVVDNHPATGVVTETEHDADDEVEDEEEEVSIESYITKLVKHVRSSLYINVTFILVGGRPYTASDSHSCNGDDDYWCVSGDFVFRSYGECFE